MEGVRDYGKAKAKDSVHLKAKKGDKQGIMLGIRGTLAFLLDAKLRGTELGFVSKSPYVSDMVHSVKGTKGRRGAKLFGYRDVGTMAVPVSAELFAEATWEGNNPCEVGLNTKLLKPSDIAVELAYGGGFVATEDPNQIEDIFRYLSGAESTKTRFRIPVYWDSRPHGYTALGKTLLKAERSVLVAGVALSTFTSTVLRERKVKNSIARHIAKDKRFSLQVLVLTDIDNARAAEQGIEDLSKRVQEGRHDLIAFRDDLVKLVGAAKVDRAFSVRSYVPPFVPRHFIASIDGTTFFGPYLSHLRGTHSYLMRVKRGQGELFELMSDEIAYVLERTKPVPPEFWTIGYSPGSVSQ